MLLFDLIIFCSFGNKLATSEIFCRRKATPLFWYYPSLVKVTQVGPGFGGSASSLLLGLGRHSEVDKGRGVGVKLQSPVPLPPEMVPGGGEGEF
jgi:hypothetical protein